MKLTPVTDQSLLEALDAAPSLKPVTDLETLRMLEDVARVPGGSASPAAPRAPTDGGFRGTPMYSADNPPPDDSIAESRVINGKTWHRNKYTGEIFTDGIPRTTDPEILKAFGKTRPTDKALNRAIILNDQSSAWGDLQAGWEALKGSAAAGSFYGDTRNVEQFDRMLDAMRKAGTATPQQIAVLERMRAQAMQGQADAIGRMSAARQAGQQIPQSPAAQTFDNAATFGDAWRAFAADPYSVSRSTILRSAPASMPSVAGGIIGSALGPAGAAGGAGVGSAIVELGSSIEQGLAEAGADLSNPESVRQVWATQGQDILRKAYTRAGIIGAFDAATAGIGSKIVANPADGLMRSMGQQAAGTGVQIAGGAGGEATAQLATEGKITQPGAIAGEALGEAVFGGVETAGQALMQGGDRDAPSVPPQPQQPAPGKGSPPPGAVPPSASAAPQPQPVQPSQPAPPPGRAPWAPGAGPVQQPVVKPQPAPQPQGRQEPRLFPQGAPAAQPNLRPATPAETAALDGAGSRTAPVREVQAETDLDSARIRVNTAPSEAQVRAGNYAKGHVKLHGFDIAIENPKGSVRKSKDPANPWESPPMPGDYGYIKGVEGKDGDKLDVLIGPSPVSQKVYVIDQNDLNTGKFDEHKTIIGANSADEAVGLYTGGFSDGRGENRIGAVTELTVEEFRQWVKSGDTRKPIGKNYRPAAPKAGTAPKAPPRLRPATPQEVAQLDQVPSQPVQVNVQERSGERSPALDVNDQQPAPQPEVPATESASQAIKVYRGGKRGFQPSGAGRYGGVGAFSVSTDRKQAEGYGQLSEGELAAGAKILDVPGSTVSEVDIRRARMNGYDAIRPLGSTENEIIIVRPEAVTAAPAETPTKPEQPTSVSQETPENAASQTEQAPAKPNSAPEDSGVVTTSSNGVTITTQTGKPDFTPPTIATMERQAFIEAHRQRLFTKKGGRVLFVVPTGQDPASSRATHVLPQQSNGKLRPGVTLDQALGQLYDETPAFGRVPKAAAKEKAQEVSRAQYAEKLEKALAYYPSLDVEANAEYMASLLSQTVTDNHRNWVKHLIYAAHVGKFDDHLKPFNKASRRTFERMFGVRLPKTERDTKTFIEQNAPIPLKEADQSEKPVEAPAPAPEPQKPATDWKAEGSKAFAAGKPARVPAEIAGDKKAADAWLSGWTAANVAAPVEGWTPAEQQAMPSYGSNNKLVSKDRAAELREKLKAKLKNQVSSGFDPEIMAMGAELAAFHIEAGARKFLDFAKAIASDLGTEVKQIRPYLRAWYNGARDLMEDAGLNVADMEGPDEVKAALASLDEDAAAPGETKITIEPAALVQEFRDYFGAPDNSFASITEARKFAAEKGYVAKPGTREAKALDEMIEQAIRKAYDDLFATMEATPTADGNVMLGNTGRPTPGLYSGLLKAVEGLKQEKAPAAQWLGTIRNQPSVKAEELSWIGLEDWLSRQTGTVTKAQIADFVRANQVQVSEVEKGASPPADLAVVKAKEFIRQKTGKDPDEAYGYTDPFDYINLAESMGFEWDPDAAEYQPEYGRTGSTTKFSQYQLPGGENYRELLLTLPTVERDIDTTGWRVDHAPGYFLPYKVVNAENEVIAGFDENPDGDADLIAKAAKDYERRAGKAVGEYRSGHWDEPNVLAHVRFNERTDAQGRKILFLEELQSDWMQQGRKKGFAKPLQPLTTEEEAEYRSLAFIPWADRTQEQRDRVAELGNRANATPNDRSPGVPDAPFKTTWPELLFKRMIRWAAENGFDALAWTPGDVQAERYDLSKQIDAIHYLKLGADLYQLFVVEKGGRSPRGMGEHTGAQLVDQIGKEMADKIVNGEGRGLHGPDSATRVLDGLNLKVGGEGMRAFYDTELVYTANRLGKKFGAKVGKTSIFSDRKTRQQPNRNLTNAAGQFLSQLDRQADDFRSAEDRRMAETQFHVLDITPAMRTAAMEGLPLFKQRTKDAPVFVVTKKQVQEANAKAQALARQILGHSVRVEVFDKMPDFVPKDFIAAYNPSQRAVYLSMKAAHDMAFNIGHEAIHHLRSVGAITDAEFRVLVAEAKRQNPDGLAQARLDVYREQYKGRYGVSEQEFRDMIEEEAVADLFGSYVDGRVTGNAKANSLLQKIKDFIEALFRLMEGMGFDMPASLSDRAEMIMRDIYEGGRTEAAAAPVRTRSEIMGGDVQGTTGRDITKTEAFKRLTNLLSSDSAARDMVSPANKPVIDGLKRHGAAIRDFLEGQTFTPKTDSRIDVPLSVVRHVVSVADNEQVLRAVIRLLPVDVMNFLRRQKLAPEHLLRDEAMLKDVLSMDVATPVAPSVDVPVSLALLRSVADVTAEIARLTGGSLEGNAALAAGTNDPVLGTHDRKDITKTPAFLRWFGDSKVVDAKGNPLVVYHGTRADFAEFDPSRQGSRNDGNDTSGFFFTEEADEADGFSWASPGSGDRSVMPVYVAIKDPLIIRTGKKSANDYWYADKKRRDQSLNYARNGQRDGIILVPDVGPRHFIAFSPTQIKSVFNRGTFDPKDPAILGMAPADDGGRTFTADPSMATDAEDQVISDFAGNINLRYIDAPEDAKTLLREVSKQFEDFTKARRGVVSHEQTRKLAEDLGMTADKLLKRKAGQAFNAHEIYAARALLMKSAEAVKKAAARTKNTSSDVERAEFMRVFTRHAAIQEQVAGLAAEAGRALNQYRMLAGADYIKGISDYLSEKTSRGKIGPEAINDLANMVDDLNTSGQIGRMARDAFKPGFWDMVREYYINSLLSGPTTQIVNTISNLLIAVNQVPETWLAEQIGRFRDGEKVEKGEAMARAIGLLEGSREGLQLAWKTLKTGEQQSPESQFDQPTQKAIPGIVGEVVRVPSRLMMTSDEYFKTINYRAEINAQAIRKAMAEGLKGQALAERIAELKMDPTADMMRKAAFNAKYQTFQNKLGTKGQTLMRFRESWHLWWLFPFLRTPINIIKYAAERSPLGPVFMREVRENLSGRNGAAARDTQIARIALGTSMLLGMAAFVLSGAVTGGGADDEREKAAERAGGWQPYSIKIGDTYYSYLRFDPFSLHLGIVADMVEFRQKMKKGEYEDLAWMVAASVISNITDKTWLKSSTEFSRMTDDPKRYMENYASHLVSGFVPNLSAQIARFNDPVFRDAKSMLDKIKERVPGLRETLSPRRNIFGEIITGEGNLGPDLLSPVYLSTERNQDMVQAFRDANFFPSMPGKAINGHELTQAQYDRYSELAGVEAAKDLARIVKRPNWARKDQDEKEDAIREVFTKARELARKKMKREFPELREKAEE